MRSRVVRLTLAIFAAAVLLAAPAHSRPASPPGTAPAPAMTIPVRSDDPTWGSPLAPVTLVHFYDLQCPFSARMQATLAELRKHYGPQQLRVVYKHFPLDFHPNARPAAEVAAAIHRLGGMEAFERFRAAAFDALQKDEGPLPAIRKARQSPSSVERLVDGGAPAQKVDEDLALGRRLGVGGTPQSFVNGVKVSGAQSADAFRKAIDKQLDLARKLGRRGVGAADVSRRLTQQNLAAAPTAAAPAAAPAPPAAPTPVAPETVWKVPIAGSPVRGPRTALVTLVVFSDFQCPFCSRLVQTFAELERKYGQQLRFVFKHNPLSFHPRAEPAAQLSMEAFARLGHAGFWRAHDLLFEQQRELEDAHFEQIATQLGLSPQRTLQAVRQHKHRKRIEADQAWADEIGARGTPTSFINGRMVVGARPTADFATVIDEELAKARALVSQGVPPQRVYRHLQRTAKSAPPPPTKTVPAATAAQPSRGAPSAPVTIQIFGDFECPYSDRVRATLEQLERRYGAKIRIVWRHLPLTSHPHARQAATLAAEAFRQGGSAAFWKMHDRLFDHRRDLGRTALLAHAAALGLNVAAAERALDGDSHASSIDGDLTIAAQANITGTPSFVINGYFLSGAQPLSKFERLVDRALREAGKGP